MSLLSRYLDDAYNAWMGSVMGCCSARPRDPDRTSIRGFEIHDPRTIYHHQPQLIPPPSAPLAESRPHTRSSSQEWITRTRSFASRASSRGSYSLKRKLNMYNGSTTSTKRPYISAPSDFRHSVAGSFTHPLRPRPSLPGSLSTQQLLAALDDEPPLNYPPPARLRSNTATTLPILSEQVERVKSVLLEREALDKRIRDVDGLIEERRSMSLKSRPASIYTSSEEPMPHLTSSEIE
ncbi:hypothetical protein VE04_09234, partial [Pseudogymnoascus sp. 24MN13]